MILFNFVKLEAVMNLMVISLIFLSRKKFHKKIPGGYLPGGFNI